MNFYQTYVSALFEYITSSSSAGKVLILKQGTIDPLSFACSNIELITWSQFSSRSVYLIPIQPENLEYVLELRTARDVTVLQFFKN